MENKETAQALDDLEKLLFSFQLQQEDYYHESGSQIKNVIQNWDRQIRKFNYIIDHKQKAHDDLDLQLIIVGYLHGDKFEENQSCLRDSLRQKQSQQKEQFTKSEQIQKDQEERSNEKVEHNTQQQKDDNIQKQSKHSAQGSDGQQDGQKNKEDQSPIQKNDQGDDHDKQHNNKQKPISQEIVGEQQKPKEDDTKEPLIIIPKIVLQTVFFTLEFKQDNFSDIISIGAEQMKVKQTLTLQVSQQAQILAEFEIRYQQILEGLLKSSSFTIQLKDLSGKHNVNQITVRFDVIDYKPELVQQYLNGLTQQQPIEKIQQSESNDSKDPQEAIPRPASSNKPNNLVQEKQPHEQLPEEQKIKNDPIFKIQQIQADFKFLKHVLFKNIKYQFRFNEKKIESEAITINGQVGIVKFLEYSKGLTFEEPKPKKVKQEKTDPASQDQVDIQQEQKKDNSDKPVKEANQQNKQRKLEQKDADRDCLVFSIACQDQEGKTQKFLVERFQNVTIGKKQGSQQLCDQQLEFKYEFEILL